MIEGEIIETLLKTRSRPPHPLALSVQEGGAGIGLSRCSLSWLREAGNVSGIFTRMLHGKEDRLLIRAEGWPSHFRITGYTCDTEGLTIRDIEQHRSFAMCQVKIEIVQAICGFATGTAKIAVGTKPYAAVAVDHDVIWGGEFELIFSGVCSFCDLKEGKAFRPGRVVGTGFLQRPDFAIAIVAPIGYIGLEQLPTLVKLRAAGVIGKGDVQAWGSIRAFRVPFQIFWPVQFRHADFCFSGK